MAFYNPYHFVSAKTGQRIDDFPVENFQASNFSTHKHLQQDRFLNQAKAGRIICRVTTESALVVGDNHDDKSEPTKVEQYFLDNKPAIPATTLRGLISSTVEAATNSTLRVLSKDDFYSYRRQMDKGLSAIGTIVFEAEKPRLRPLTLPTVNGVKGEPVKVRTEYQKVFEKPNLKVYLNKPVIYKTYRNDDKQFFYLKIQNRNWQNDGTFIFDDNQHWKDGRGVDYLISQKSLKNNLLTQQDYNKITDENERKEYTRGILRILATSERDLPNTRTHEIFIPYTEESEKWKTLEIPQNVMHKFYELSDQMTETVKKKVQAEIRKARSENKSEEAIKSIKRKLLPYEPIDTIRNSNPKNDDDFTFRLKEGDLVYFSLDEKSQVNEISLSSIWRDRKEMPHNGEIKGVTAHDFFEIIDQELLPFNSKREQITLAEQMFGFVEQVTDENKKPGLALAGRINFSAARALNRPEDDYLEREWKTLKILASPKPPSPAMYFKKSNGQAGYVSKNELKPSRTGSHPQGRKFYLHHKNTNNWETKEADENVNQKMQIKPVKKGVSFLFHIDFENLSPVELGALLYALDPTDKFRHKIGLGKPLGLGSVKIDIEGLFLINRSERYSVDGLFTQRYSEFWRNDEKANEWSDLYHQEKNADSKESAQSVEDFKQNFCDIAKEIGNGEILYSIETLGSSVFNNVHYPSVEGQIRDQIDEVEHFKWFVANDSGSGSRNKGTRIDAFKKPLKPIFQDQPFPALDEYPFED